MKNFENLKLILIILSIIIIIILIMIFIVLNSMKPKDNIDISMDAPKLDTSLKFDKLGGKSVLFSLEEIIKENIPDIQTFYMQEVYYKDIKYDVETEYYIYGISFRDNYNTIEKDYIIIRQNYEKMLYTFEIKQRNITKEQFQQIIQNKANEKGENSEVKYNNNNVFNLKNISNEDLVRRYTDYYITLALYSPSDAYEILDNDYREKKFKTLDQYKEYIENNRKSLENYTLKKYAYNDEGENTRYIAVDSEDNYYIIEEIELLNIKIQLDNYTIEDKKYVEEYNKLSNEEKVNICLSKVLKMINNKEYNDLYNLLDETYKSTYFMNFEDFKKYINDNYFYNNEFISSNISFNVNSYICEVKIKSGVGVSALEKTNTIIIQLANDTSFKISFSK